MVLATRIVSGTLSIVGVTFIWFVGVAVIGFVWSATVGVTVNWWLVILFRFRG